MRKECRTNSLSSQFSFPWSHHRSSTTTPATCLISSPNSSFSFTILPTKLKIGMSMFETRVYLPPGSHLNITIPMGHLSFLAYWWPSWNKLERGMCFKWSDPKPAAKGAKPGLCTSCSQWAEIPAGAAGTPRKLLRVLIPRDSPLLSCHGISSKTLCWCNKTNWIGLR